MCRPPCPLPLHQPHQTLRPLPQLSSLILPSINLEPAVITVWLTVDEGMECWRGAKRMMGRAKRRRPERMQGSVGLVERWLLSFAAALRQ